MILRTYLNLTPDSENKPHRCDPFSQAPDAVRQGKWNPINEYPGLSYHRAPRKSHMVHSQASCNTKIHRDQMRINSSSCYQMFGVKGTWPDSFLQDQMKTHWLDPGRPYMGQATHEWDPRWSEVQKNNHSLHGWSNYRDSHRIVL